jgi:hypothetical protein
LSIDIHSCKSQFLHLTFINFFALQSHYRR